MSKGLFPYFVELRSCARRCCFVSSPRYFVSSGQDLTLRVSATADSRTVAGETTLHARGSLDVMASVAEKGVLI